MPKCDCDHCEYQEEYYDECDDCTCEEQVPELTRTEQVMAFFNKYRDNKLVWYFSGVIDMLFILLIIYLMRG
jgi:hypothetical protein